MSNGFHQQDDSPLRSYDSQLMRRLLEYVRPYRKWMYTATGLLLLAALISNITPLLLMTSVDKYMNNPARLALAAGHLDQLRGLQTKDLRGLLEMGLIIAVLGGVEALLRYAQMAIVAVIGQRTMFAMRMGLFAHVQRLSVRFIDRNPVGRLMTRITNDVEKIQETIVSGVVNVASDLLTLVAVLIFMFAVNWRLALTALSPVPFVFAVSFIFRKYAQRSFLEVRRKLAKMNAFMQETLSGMRVVQLFGRERRNFEQYDALNADHRDEWLRQVRNFAVYFPSIEFLGAFSTAVIIFYCGNRILSLGHEVSGDASVGTMFAFVFLADRFFGPIKALADRYNLLLEAMASSERVFQLLDTPEDVADPPEPHAPEHLEGRVEFRDVWFSYGAEAADAEPEWVLRDVSFTVAPGEVVAVVGHTGAGKSTLINLLSRFYDVQRGAVLVDGVDVRAYAQKALRGRIGVVLQDVFLFSGSIEENIRLGDETMAPEWVRRCAEYVNAAPFIERMPEGYAYHVGERGGNLSTGQRQLIAFARALAHQPDILVLDEATANIDTETEQLIQSAIARLLHPETGRRRTCIVIAHRLSTVRHADRILVMHHGRLREQGTHEELMAQGGLYKTLYELQYNDPVR